jgi:selenide,water dikinase
MGGVPGARGVVTPVKPINRFVERWERMSRRILAATGRVRIGVVGAAAGGVAIMLAVPFWLEQMLALQGKDTGNLEIHLFSKTDTVLPYYNHKMKKIFDRVLGKRGIIVHAAQEVTAVESGKVLCADGTNTELDEILWVTPASAAPWLEGSELDVDENGFVRVRDTLQSVSHPEIFAAGDIAAVIDHPRPKAGVFAVRQGPPLADNLRRALIHRPLKPFAPQSKFLTIISTGDKYAVAARGGWAVKGAWVWRWKDWIDRRWMRKYHDLPEMAEDEAPGIQAGLADAQAIKEISAIAMRCGGCGAKVGSTVLGRALNQLQPVDRDDVLIGLHEPDDAAVVEVPPGKVMVHTVDFFRSFIDDAYVFGQIAANHSLGDIFAMGAEPQTALAIASVPYGLEAKVEDDLSAMMAGAMKVFAAANTALVGGHTSEGAELALGFSINGLANRDQVLRKAGMRPGDRLILTKGLGTGTLFAADMRLKAKGRWIDGALESMLQSNRDGARCLFDHGATACTDVTGFGLLGHLVEMTRPSGVDVELDLGTLPVLDGALETLRMGVFSSLQPANVRLRRAIRDLDGASKDERFPLIFDPQTAGGLLASVPGERAADCVTALRDMGYGQSAVIGTVKPESNRVEPVTLVV